MKIWMTQLLVCFGFCALSQNTSAIFKAKANELELPEVTREAPVALNAVIMNQEDKTFIVVKIGIMENWHIYGYVPPGGYFIQSKLDVKAPEGVSAKSVLKPKMKGYTADPGILIYKGDLVFAFELHGEVQAGQAIEVRLDYQPCDPYICLPPNYLVKSLSVS